MVTLELIENRAKRQQFVPLQALLESLINKDTKWIAKGAHTKPHRSVAPHGFNGGDRQRLRNTSRGGRRISKPKLYRTKKQTELIRHDTAYFEEQNWSSAGGNLTPLPATQHKHTAETSRNTQEDSSELKARGLKHRKRVNLFKNSWDSRRSTTPFSCNMHQTAKGCPQDPRANDRSEKRSCEKTPLKHHGCRRLN